LKICILEKVEIYVLFLALRAKFELPKVNVSTRVIKEVVPDADHEGLDAETFL
jgi:hypothetical protein